MQGLNWCTCSGVGGEGSGGKDVSETNFFISPRVMLHYAFIPMVLFTAKRDKVTAYQLGG